MMNVSILKVVICLVVLQLAMLEGYLLPTLPSGVAKNMASRSAMNRGAAKSGPPSILKLSRRNPFASSMLLQAAAKGGKKSSGSGSDEDAGKYTDVSALPTGGVTKTLSVEDVKKMMEEESADDDDMLPDKESFAKYFKKHATGSGKDKVISKELFMQYEDVVELIKEELVAEEDVSTLWDSVAGSESGEGLAGGLGKEEAYEMLCMITDMPNADEQGYFDEEFLRLAGVDPDTIPTAGGELGDQRDCSGVSVTYKQFMDWEEVKEMINEKMLTQEEIDSIWTDIVGDKNKKTDVMDREMFDSVNLAIDAALGDTYDEGEGDGDDDEDGGEEDEDGDDEAEE